MLYSEEGKCYAQNGGGNEVSNNSNGGGDEKIAFGSMAKGQKKYGSIITPQRLSRSMTEDQPTFIYDVQSHDTMQGLAVKFGVTTEQIRRANQMWTNDSLFLRSKLLIPYSASSRDDLNNGHVPQIQPSSSSTCSSINEVHVDQHQHNSSQGHASTSSISSPQEEMSCTSSGNNNKHWTHPLSDSFESEDCIVSPSSVKLETDSSTPSCSPYLSNGRSSNHNGSSNNVIWSPVSSNGNPHHGTSSNPEFGSHSTPVSPSKKYFVHDHSEKSAEDFLARIDSAIESKRRQVKLKSDSFNKKPWVTFESDSESEKQSSSRTSLRTEGRHLRYSLKKLEKAQDELFEL